MKFRQSLLQFEEKNGASKASRRYNKTRSYIYFRKARWDGTVESLACQSRRPHKHPNQHTKAELKLIFDYRRRNPKLGLIELWDRLRKVGYTRRPESLFRVLQRMGLLGAAEEKKKKYVPKPYESMDHAGERVQIDVKVVPTSCIADPELKLYQFTAIDELSRLRYLGAYDEHSSYSAADFLRKTVAWFKRKGIKIECVQTDNGCEFTTRLLSKSEQSQTLFEKTAAELGIKLKHIKPYTPRHNGKVERSHREDQKRLYDSHRFFSFDDFRAQLAVHNRRSNQLPMRPLPWLSPVDFLNPG
jgi:transposase InsO family protein